jgi:hypothetical protein
VAAANTAADLLTGMPPALWWTWAIILAGVLICAPLATIALIAAMVRGDGLNAGLVVATVILVVVFVSFVSFVRMLMRNRPGRMTVTGSAPP